MQMQKYICQIHNDIYEIKIKNTVLQLDTFYIHQISTFWHQLVTIYFYTLPFQFDRYSDLTFLTSLFFARKYQTNFIYVIPLYFFYNHLQKTTNMKALIIVDPQNDFCQGGPLAVTNSNTIFPKINFLRSKLHFDYTFITLDWHPTNHISFAKNHNLPSYSLKTINEEQYMLWPVHCLQNSEGAMPSKLLKLTNDQIYIKKGQIQNQQQYSGFGTQLNPTELEEKLRELDVSEVFVVGLALDYCVGSTALDAKRLGFDVTIVKQGTRSVAKETGIEMVKIMGQKGIKCVSIKQLVQ